MVVVMVVAVVSGDEISERSVVWEQEKCFETPEKSTKKTDRAREILFAMFIQKCMPDSSGLYI